MSYRAIEKEYKALISQEKYEWLYRKRNWNDSFLQKNHYYDTEDLLLYRNNITFRIREVNNKMYIQTKCPNEQLVGSYSIKNECEVEIDNIPDVFSNDEIGTYVTNICVQTPLILLGSLETFRCVEKIDDVFICLDKNCYFDIVDYEVEIEFSEISNCLTKTLHDLQVEPVSQVGKYSRFISRLMRCE